MQKSRRYHWSSVNSWFYTDPIQVLHCQSSSKDIRNWVVWVMFEFVIVTFRKLTTYLNWNHYNDILRGTKKKLNDIVARHYKSHFFPQSVFLKPCYQVTNTTINYNSFVDLFLPNGLIRHQTIMFVIIGKASENQFLISNEMNISWRILKKYWILHYNRQL